MKPKDVRDGEAFSKLIVVQVSKVYPSKDRADISYTPKNDADTYNHDLCKYLFDEALEYHLIHIDAPETYRDAPVSLQLVARRHQEEKLIAAMEYVQKLL